MLHFCERLKTRVEVVPAVVVAVFGFPLKARPVISSPLSAETAKAGLLLESSNSWMLTIVHPL